MNSSIFFENFELLADSTNGIRKLRELIMQLAVMGKLVPQYLNDEPASDLTEKSAKSLKTVRESEIPFDCPKSWIFTHMDQVSNAIHYGYTASADDSLKDVRLLRITDIQNNKVNWETVPGCEIDTQKLNGYVLNNNDLLIARTGGTIGKSYLVENLAVRAVFASYLIRIIPNHLIVPKYLKLYADSPFYWDQLYSKCAGTGQPNVNATSLKSLIVPLPSLAEQKRIVSKVDELMALCDKLEARRQKKQELKNKLNSAALDKMLSAENQEEFEQHWQRICENFDLLYDNPENVEKLKQSILQLAVQGKLVPQNLEDEPVSVLIEKINTETSKLVKEKKIQKIRDLQPIDIDETPYNIPREWLWTRFGNIAPYIEAGWSPMCEKRPKENEEWGVLKISAVSWGVFNPLENKALPSSLSPKPEYEVKPYDFLMSRANTSDLVGRSVIVEDTIPKLMINDKVLRLFFSGFVSKNFYNLYNNSQTARFYYAKEASGTSSSMKNICREVIYNMPVPLPPLEEQKRIVEKVEHLMGLCNELETKLRKEREDSEKLMEAVVRVY